MRCQVFQLKKGVSYILLEIFLILVLKKMKCIYFVIIYSNMLKKNWFSGGIIVPTATLNLIKSKKFF